MAHAQVDITEELVQGLLRDQHPDLADLPLRFGARGWDNQLWRLGDDLAVRLPWATADADELLIKEHALLPAIAPRLPLQVPVPQRLGQPSERFPRAWIVTTWVAGEPADRAPATRGAEAADTLAALLAALHQPAPYGAPAGRHNRSGPLADSNEDFAYFLRETTDRGLVPDPDAVREVWDDALAAPGWTGPALWLHLPACSSAMPESTAARVEKPRGARRPALRCGASPQRPAGDQRAQGGYQPTATTMYCGFVTEMSDDCPA
ncbi:MAG TPA: phosphotransferase [Streptosporangiaceae bacterium]|nr:phosphotransferase [Streptosporangiaceae bacterium]